MIFLAIILLMLICIIGIMLVIGSIYVNFDETSHLYIGEKASIMSLIGIILISMSIVELVRISLFL